jgi:glutathione S-transferase
VETKNDYDALVTAQSKALQVRGPREPSGALRAPRILHQFPGSHFCEKARWCLDVKSLDYTVRNLVPGLHGRINRRLAGKSSVPLLIDDGRVIHGSSAIASYLEGTYPGPRLLPNDDGLRALVLALEGYFDGTVGPAARHWIYGQLLRRPGTATRNLFHGYSSSARWTGRLLRPFVERRLASMYPPDATSMATVESTLLEGIERLENTMERDPDHFLVAEMLTLADVSAAALLAPLVGPPNSPWADVGSLTPALLAMRQRLLERPGGQWVLRRYERDRHHPDAPGVALGPVQQ